MREHFVCVFEPLIDVMYLCNKCLGRSCCAWFGTDGNLSPLLINQTWYSPEETVEPSREPVLPLRHEFKVPDKLHVSHIHWSSHSKIQLPSLFYRLAYRSSIWPTTWPVRWCGSLTWLAWCCCCVTGMAAYSSWFPCCRTSPQTAGCPSTRWR